MLVGLLVLAVTALAMRDYGLTTDEVTYIECNQRIGNWVAGFSEYGWKNWTQERLRAGWTFGVEENKSLTVPALVSWAGYGLVGHFDSPPASWRWGNVLLFAATCGLMYGWLRAECSTGAALVGLAALLGTPRAFANACLYSVDPLVGCLWVWAAWALVDWCRRGTSRFPLLFSVLVAVGIAVKPTFWFAVPVLLLWVLLFHRRRLLRLVAALATITPLVVLLLCPMWWWDPLGGVIHYFNVLRAPRGWEGVDAYYLGEIYQMPGTPKVPWHAVPVLTFLTTPLWILTMFLLGVYLWMRDDHRTDTVALWLGSACALPLAVMLLDAPRHDGVRLFLAAFFFIALIVGYGFEQVMRLLHVFERCRSRGELAAVLVAAALAAWPVLRIHPGELSYYNVLVGGLRGAAEPVHSSANSPVNPRPLYELTFWWELLDADDWKAIQAEVPPNARLWIFPDYIGTPLLKEWGVLRPDVEVVEQSELADCLLVYGRLGRITSPEVNPLGHLFFRGRPVWERRLQDVRMAALFRQH